MAAVLDRYDIFTINEAGCGSVSGSSGYLPIRLNAHDLGIYVGVLSNGDVYICPRGGWLEWYGSGLVHGNSWPIRMVGDTSSFRDTGPSSGRDLRTPVILSDITYASSTKAWYTFSKWTLPKVGEPLDSSWSGYKCATKLDNWEKVDKNSRKRAYYIAFPAHNNGGDVNQITYDSVKIVFESDIFDPDYYPGKIFNKKNDWSDARSCNRKKTGSISAGYFKRLNKNKVLIDRKNNTTNKDKCTVWIHNGSGFNRVAPKIGVE